MKMLSKSNRYLLVILVLSLFWGCGAGESNGEWEREDSGTGIQSTASSPAEMNVGDLMVFEFEDEEVEIDFRGVGVDAAFILITGTSDIDLGTNFEITGQYIQDDDLELGFHGDVVEDHEGDPSPRDLFSYWLRRAGREMSTIKKYSEGSSGYYKSLNGSEEERFKVLNSISSPAGEYVSVEAGADCVGEYIALFVDDRIEEYDLSENEVMDICSELDELASNVIALLGPPSDINGDGLVTILITPQINIMGSRLGGPLGGYFYSADLYGPNSTSIIGNHREIIYAQAPDTRGRYGVTVDKDLYLGGQLQTIVVHELQHLINYSRRVLINGGFAEEFWLDEGMSHLMEDLMGYGGGNGVYSSMFLTNPSQASLVTDEPPNYGERGASYMFLRFLHEKAEDGDSFLRALVDTDKTGIRNLEAAFASDDPDFDRFSEFMASWTLAVGTKGRGIDIGPRYCYNDTTKNVGQLGVNKVYLSALQEYQSYSLASSSAKYYGINPVPSSLKIGVHGYGNFAILVRTE